MVTNQDSHQDQDTIFALSSGAGKAGIAVIRVSGPKSSQIARETTTKPLPAVRQATYRVFIDPHTKEIIDKGLLLFFSGPHSFTGEDLVECHVHGGRAVLTKMFQVIENCGARPAEAGEFSRRAFENGKFDLTAAEGIADIIDAETEGQRKQALRQMEGTLGVLYEGWREEMMRALALLEAEIDFPDEELPDDLSDQILPVLDHLIEAIGEHLSDHHRGERVRDGVRVAIIGQPNVGKSSLLNALARRDVAIVSDISGTTRDIIDVHLDLGGIPVILSDTAGIREDVDVIEAEGIQRAVTKAEEADIRLFVSDISQPQARFPANIQKRSGDLALLNKADLMDTPESEEDHQIVISAKTGYGLDTLLNHLTGQVSELFGHFEKPSLTRQRHRRHLERARHALIQCRDNPHREVSLRAEDVRAATQAIGEITGRTGVEDMLDLVFSEFCIGK